MTFCGFLLGSHPPAKVCNQYNCNPWDTPMAVTTPYTAVQIMQPRKAGKALRNILRAHSAAYQAMKALPGTQLSMARNEDPLDSS